MKRALSLGDEIAWADDQTATVVMVSASTITVRLDATGELAAIQPGDWYEVVGGGLCEPVDPQAELAESLAPPDALRRAELLACHIREIETGYTAGVPSIDRPWEPRPEYSVALPMGERERNKVAELATAFDSPFFGRKISALRQDRKDFRERGVLGLVDGRALRSKKTAFDADPGLVKLILAEATEWRFHPDRTLDFHLDRIRAEASKANIPCPSDKTLAALWRELGKPTGASATARRRLTIAASTGGATKKSYPLYPGERVEFDSTLVDVQVITSDGRIVRPTLTIAIDAYTRSILAFQLTEEKHTGQHVATVLRDCVTPMQYRPNWQRTVTTSYRTVSGERETTLTARLDEANGRAAIRAEGIVLPSADDAVPGITPTSVVIDNGKDYRSGQFMNACKELGVDVQVSRPYKGADKGIVERAFKTLRTQLWQYAPGYVSQSVETRGDTKPKTKKARDAAKKAQEAGEGPILYSVDQLREILAEFIACHWQHRPRSGLRLPGREDADVSPQQMWEHWVATMGAVPAPPTATDIIHTLRTDYRVISNEGIELDGRSYNSSELDAYRGRPSGYAQKGHRHPIKSHRGDLSQVFWLNPESKTWVAIPWVYAEQEPRPFSHHLWRYAARIAKAEHATPSEMDVARTLSAFRDRVASGSFRDGEQKIAVRDATETETAQAALPAKKPRPAHPAEAVPAEELPDRKFARK